MPKPGPALRRHAALVALLAVFSLLPAALSQTPGDPLPVKYVSLSGDRLTQELERLRQGHQVRLARTDFEERLRRARTAASASLPQLAEARYRAKLTNNALTGSAEWRLTHPGPGPGIFPLQPLNLALRQARFVDAEKKDVVVAEFAGTGPGLLLERLGEQVVALDWSARGEPGPQGLHFHLEVPPCAVAFLELDLPEDHLLTVAGGSVTGPHPAEVPDRRLWKIAFSRRARLDLRLRRGARLAEEIPVVLVRRQQTIQEVTPDAVEAEVRFDLEVLRGQVQELTCLCDPVLRPYEVFAPRLTGWKVQAGKAPGEPTSLLLSFGAPLSSGRLVIRCVAPLTSTDATQPWTSPWVRPAGTVPGTEELTLRIHANVALEGWDPGSFRLEKSTSDASELRLELTGGLLESPPSRANPPKALARPSARVRTQQADFHARMQTWWRAHPERPSLISHISLEILRGRLFDLSLALPADWEVDAVQMQPPLPFRYAVRSEGGQPRLVIELGQPLTPSEEAQRPLLKVHLRGRPFAPAGPETKGTLPFPDLSVIGARLHEGGLAVDIEEQRFEATLSGTPPASSAPREDGPWGTQTPDYYYLYRGRTPTGQLHLRPLPAQLRARVATNVVLAFGRAAAETTLHLQAEAGTAAAFDIFLSTPVGGRWDWKVIGGNGSVARCDRLEGPEIAAGLHVLAARNPLGGAVLLAARGRGEWRRLTLTRPLGPRESLTLQATCELLRSADGERWEVPLVTLPAATRLDGEVVLRLAGTSVVKVETEGLQETPGAAPRGRTAAPWRTFRYGEPPLALTFHGRLDGAESGPEAAVEGAALTTVLRPDGRLVHHYGFVLANWREQGLAVRLPTGTRLQAAKIDGAWIERLPPVDAREGATEVVLPVPAPRDLTAAQPRRHRYDLVYVTEGSSCLLGARLESPAPRLPVEPLVLQRIWRLPAGLLPVDDAGFRPVPGSAEGVTRPESGRRVAHRSPWTSLLGWPLAFEEWETLQREDLARVAAKESGASIGGRMFGEALEALACDHPDEAAALVLDCAALEEAGLTPTTPLPPPGHTPIPFWQTLGLVHVPCREGPLLTTGRQWDEWRIRNGELPPDVEAAVAEAVAHGHDLSGRFRRAVDWARQALGDGMGEERYSPTTPPVLADLDGRAGTAWEPVAGCAGDVLSVVRPDAAAGAGMLLAGGATLLLWRLRHAAARTRLAFLFVWLAAAALGTLWLPFALEDLAWWPLLTAGGIGLVWHLWTARRAGKSPEPRTPSSLQRLTVTAGVLALGVSIGWSDQTPPGTALSTSVFLLPVEGGEEPAVLVAPDFVRQLDALARRTSPGPRGAVLLSAEFTGKADEEGFLLESQLVVHNFEAETALLTLPFSGVRLLDDGLLDGARAYIVPGRPPQGGYVVRIERPGTHHLRLRFRVLERALPGGERELLFTVPRALQTRIASLALPPGATGFRSLVGQGEEAVERGSFRVEIGRVSAPLQFRWLPGAGPGVEARPSVREAYLWDLKPGGASLEAVLHYQGSAAALASVDIALPDPLEVVTVDARPVVTGASAGVKDWSVTPTETGRRLRLHMQAPVTGGVYVLLDLIPRQSLGETPTLSVPEPLGAHLLGGYLAYAVDGVEAHPGSREDLGKPSFSGRDREAVQPFLDFWQTAREALAQPVAVHALPPRRSGPVSLPLRLRVVPLPIESTQEVHWQVGPHLAEVQIVASLKGKGGRISLVEWQVPQEITLTRVSGRENRDAIRAWSHSGNRVQVWLQKSEAKVDLELHGWLPLGGEPGSRQFDVPAVGLLGPGAAPVLRVRTPGSIALEPLATPSLAPLVGARPSEGELVYQAQSLAYGGRFRLRPAAVEIEGRVLTTVTGVGRDLTFTSTVDLRPRRGEWTTLPLQLRYWDGEAVLKESRQVRVRGTPRRGDGLRTWILEREPGTNGPVRLVLTGTLRGAEDAVPHPLVPEVRVAGIAGLEQWVAVMGPELTAEGTQRIQAVIPGTPAWEEVRRVWGGESERLREGGSVWKVEGGNGKLRLLSQRRSAGAPAVRVFLTEILAAAADGPRWLHEGTCWLYHEANTDLQVTLPPGAQAGTVSVDGVAVTPLRSAPESLRIPLPGAAGARVVRMRWEFDAARESLERPRLERPHFQGAAEGPVFWSLQVPAGYTASAAVDRLSPTEGACLDLARAESQHRLSGALIEAARGGPLPTASLAPLQQRFVRLCRYAASTRAALRHDGLPCPDGRPFDETLQELREKNRELARTQRFEEVLADAERRARMSAVAPADTDVPEVTGGGMSQSPGPRGAFLLARGTPLFWTGGAGAPNPEVVLTVPHQAQMRRSLGTSVLVVVVLSAIWLLSRLPAVRLWARVFWPEELVLIGCLAWQSYGPSWLPAFLVLLGVAGRVVFLTRRLTRILKAFGERGTLAP